MTRPTVGLGLASESVEELDEGVDDFFTKKAPSADASATIGGRKENGVAAVASSEVSVDDER